MPRSSGTYSLPAGNPTVSGTVISTTWANTTLSDIGNELTNSLPRDGTAPPTASLPMGNFKITGIGAATLTTDAPQFQQIQSGAALYLTSVSGTNTIAGTLASPTLAAYAAGNTFRFTAAGTNTGATTLNINALGAKTVQRNGAALIAGDITSGQTYELIYDGTNFQIIGTLSARAGANADITSLTGTTTNDNAAAGKIGEYISSDVALGSAVALTTGVALNVTSISLTAGDWDVSGAVGFVTAATTNYSALITSVSLVSATLDNTLGRRASIAVAPNVPNVSAISLATKSIRLSLNATTTVYLVAQSTFTVSTITAYGNISARRVR